MTLEERYTFTPEGGESWEMFEGRLIRALRHVLELDTCHSMVIVTHGGCIRALMPYLLGLPKEESFKYNPENASITSFAIEQSGTFSPITINDTIHLV